MMLPFGYSAVFYMLVGYFDSACAGSVLLNSNAIKNIPLLAGLSHPISASPDDFSFDSGAQNMAIDTIQVSPASICHKSLLFYIDQSRLYTVLKLEV